MKKLNEYIYIYYISKDCILYDRNVPRDIHGIRRAKERIEELEKLDKEAFYTIGTTFKGAYH